MEVAASTNPGLLAEAITYTVAGAAGFHYIQVSSASLGAFDPEFVYRLEVQVSPPPPTPTPSATPTATDTPTPTNTPTPSHTPTPTYTPTHTPTPTNTPITNDPRVAEQWGFIKIHAPDMWAYGYGSPSIVIAVVDSGLDLTHPDLAPNLWLNPGEIAGNGIDDDNNGVVDDTGLELRGRQQRCVATTTATARWWPASPPPAPTTASASPASAATAASCRSR